MIDKHKTITNKTQASEINVSNYCTRKGIRQSCWIDSRERDRNILAKLALITLIYALARLTRPTWLIDVMTDSDIGAICAYLYWKQTGYPVPPSLFPLLSGTKIRWLHLGDINQFFSTIYQTITQRPVGPPSPFSGCPLFVHFIVKLAIKL